MGMGYCNEISKGDFLMRLDASVNWKGLEALDRRLKTMDRELEMMVRKTAIQVHADTVNEITASKKRHGTNELAKSYLPKKMSSLIWAVTSKLQRALVHEIGRNGGGRIVKPKTAKMLTIPLRDDVLTPSGAQISQPAKSRLFDLLKKRGKRSLMDIYEEAGIVLAKQARMSDIKGKFILRDKVRPKAIQILNRNIQDMIRKALVG